MCVCNRITTVDLGTQSQCARCVLVVVAVVNFACQLDCFFAVVSAVGDDDVDDVDDDADADRDITETFSLFLLPYS